MCTAWVSQVSNLVTKQAVVFNMPVKGCKTQDNVTVQINLSIVFRIMGDERLGEDPYLVRNFVYKVTARGPAHGALPHRAPSAIFRQVHR